MRRVPAKLLLDHSSVVAPALLGKVLRVDLGEGDVRSGRITEVEAYGGLDDPASHSARGETPRNRPMFGAAGTVYVYFTYGMHWCANIVTGAVGDPQAVLLRAVEPIEGLDAIRAARPRARRDRDLANGPAKLCEALGIGQWANGVALGADVGGRSIRLLDDGTSPPAVPLVGPRVGISVAQEIPWRFRVPS
ncbi:MAG TPA: DNA-3-methyladenine glycosylase [Microthrixaceae bacterium]|nr:DNA-3-methyladenine glycosylase [Microthrixaceae bacterium]